MITPIDLDIRQAAPPFCSTAGRTHHVWRYFVVQVYDSGNLSLKEPFGSPVDAADYATELAYKNPGSVFSVVKRIGDYEQKPVPPPKPAVVVTPYP